MALMFEDIGNEDQEQSISTNDKAFFAIDTNNEDEVLKWLTNEVNYLAGVNYEDLQRIDRNFKWSDGFKTKTEKVGFDRNKDREKNQIKEERFLTNEFGDLLDKKVSKLARFRPNVVFNPTNNEHDDKIAAKTAKEFYSHIKYVSGYEEKNLDVIKNSKTAGDGFLIVDWDKDAGPLHPQIRKAQEQGVEVEIEVGGEKKKIKDARIGELVLISADPRFVLMDNKTDFDKVDFFFWVDSCSKDALRKDYKDKVGDTSREDKLAGDSFSKYFKPDDSRDAVVVHFWHRKTKYLPNGFYAKFTSDVLLETKDFPFSQGYFEHSKLNLFKLPGRLVKGKLRGSSFFDDIGEAVEEYDRTTRSIARQIRIAGMPKWMVPKGSTKIETLVNKSTIVSYKGPRAPELKQMNPVSSQSFNFRGELKEDFQRNAGVFGGSRGEPPSGVTAAVALQFLDEQESQGENSNVVLYNAHQRNVAWALISAAGEKYDPSDERMMSIRGRDSVVRSKGLEVGHLTKSFDVRIQNASALPETKALRTQTILDLKERFPNLISDEQATEMLELGQSDKFLSVSSAAVRLAELENEQILDGEDVPEPEEYEYHVEHWLIHAQRLQEPSFKLDAPKEVKQRMRAHVMVHEMHMTQLAKTSAGFQERLSTLKQFPLYFKSDLAGPSAVETPSRPQQTGAPSPLTQEINQDTVEPTGEPIDGGN